MYAVLREAIESSGKVALTRVVIAQRERTISLRPMEGGLVAHTLNEQRDLNPSQQLFDDVRDVKLDPEMIGLAKQLVERQTEDYDPADLEDRYETRLRAMLDAKIAGEGRPAGDGSDPRRQQRHRPDGGTAEELGCANAINGREAGHYTDTSLEQEGSRAGCADASGA